MAAYLFQLELSEFSDDLAAVVPFHREHINKLFSEGRILSYSVSIHRNLIWCVINAEEEQEAMEMVLAFPLYPHFVEVSCHPLLFHNTLPATLPGISLN
ncbi:MAG: hypothetical protein JWQ38_2145 [Flavipsychrobacter sp.]|nr:hypothetical protein [Flavipsychrobacter sp.]